MQGLPLVPTPPPPAAAPLPGSTPSSPLHAANATAAYVTNAERSGEFPWTPAKRSAQQALSDAFPGGYGWRSMQFSEGVGGVWTRQALAAWVEKDLLGGPDPFSAHGGKVPVPASAAAGREDQLGPGQWVGYSRRQVCFIVAKSLLGAGTKGYANGLLRFMEKSVRGTHMARTGAFGRAWWVLLAACAADPNLAAGGQGPLLLAAKAGGPPSVDSVRAASEGADLSAAGLRVCGYDDGTSALPAGLDAVPAAGCAQPTSGGPGRDFMTGGLKGQALQDISAAWLGGYVFGTDAGLEGGGQDERLMVYMPEVAALAFFLSQNPGQVAGPGAPQLRQPVWILGARRVATGIDGTCRFNVPMVWDSATPLVGDLVEVELGGKSYHISSSMPFLAFQSENQRAAFDLRIARRDKDPKQRDVDPKSGVAFDKQVRAWYRSVALTSYDPAVRPVLKAVVRSLGTGPWLAGLWFGDPQLGLLASWIGHAAAAASWEGALNLDYYVYSAFTENPGSQCFVHSRKRCRACIARCAANPLPRTAFWLPKTGWVDGGSCATYPDDCGERGLEDVVGAYKNKTASELWGDLETALRKSGRSTDHTVFDLLVK